MGTPAFCPMTKRQTFLEEIIQASYKHILPTLSLILRGTSDESQLQTYLNCYQQSINLAGSLLIPNARDSFLSGLAQFCLPPHSHC